MKADTEIDSFHFDSSSCDNFTSKRRETPLPLLGTYTHSSLLGLFWPFYFDLGNRGSMSSNVSSATAVHPSDCKLLYDSWKAVSWFIKISKCKIGMKNQNLFHAFKREKKKKKPNWVNAFPFGRFTTLHTYFDCFKWCILSLTSKMKSHVEE